MCKIQHILLIVCFISFFTRLHSQGIEVEQNDIKVNGGNIEVQNGNVYLNEARLEIISRTGLNADTSRIYNSNGHLFLEPPSFNVEIPQGHGLTSDYLNILNGEITISDGRNSQNSVGIIENIDGVISMTSNIGGIYIKDRKVRLGNDNSLAPDITTSIHHGTVGPPSGDGLRLANMGFNGNSWELYTVNGSGGLLFYENNTAVTELKEDGTFMIGSDRQLKRDIQYFENDYAGRINRLRPASYHYKHLNDKSAKRSYGMIAQEVQKVFPEVVHEMIIDEGSDERVLGISYTDFIPILIKGFQEQHQEISTLRDENEILKERLARIEKLILADHKREDYNDQ